MPGATAARDGFRFLWRDDLLRVLVGAAVAGLLFISASLTVEVFYIKDVVGAGDAGYALTGAAWMIGMVAGATGLATRVARGGGDRHWRAPRSRPLRSRARAWPSRRRGPSCRWSSPGSLSAASPTG